MAILSHTANMEKLRVLILEDDAWTRTMVSNALTSEFDVVGQAGDSKTALDLAASKQPNIAILDMDLGSGPTGIDVARALRQRLPDIAIVLLTSYASPKLFRSGLPELPSDVSYVRKSDISDFETLLKVVRDAVNGKASVGPDPLNLSDPLVETLMMLAQGLTNAEIAKRRFVSEKAVEQAIARLARHFDIPQEPASNTRVLLTRTYLRMTGQQLHER